MTLKTLILRYAAFAVIAMGANLAVQNVVFRYGDTGGWFMLAMGAGTIVGLVVKYLLDKRWIFLDFASGMKDHSRKFTLYTVMGIVTTAIFWGTETAFWLIWRTDGMRDLGAVIGLTVGYVIKYNLDRRFVFTDRQLEAAS